MQGLSTTLRNLGVVRLMAMGGVAIGIIVFFIFLSTRLNSTEMSLLYGELDSGDGAKIISKLESMGIPYQLRAGGRQIMVPADKALRLRMSMAEAGLPNGGSIGYEIFDRSQSLGVTNFVQNVNLLRALEGELARTIRSLNDIQEARIHLVLPKRELFSRRRQEPSASVVIKTRGRGKLTKSNVLSIQHLVAAAVPGLKLSRISIIDDRGRLLARAASGDESDDMVAANNDELKIAHEQRLIRTIEELLEQSIGIGRVRAQVTMEMDFDRVTTNSELYDPDGQVVRSTQTIEETADSNDRNNKSGVSVANNLPSNQGISSGGAASASASKRSEETVNYEISKTIRTHVRESGTVRRMSIAVLIDGTYGKKGEDGKQIYQARSQEQIDKLAKLIRSAVGFDAKRGDTLEIVNMRFVNATDEDLGGVEPLFGLTKTDYFRIAEIFVLTAVGILVILLVVRPLVSRTLEALPGALASAEQNLLAAHSAETAALSGPADTGTGALPGEDFMDDLIDVAQIEGKVRASTLKKIEEIVERHPEETVGILRQWMNSPDN